MDGDGRTIEVCREFMQDRCKRSPEECKFAHPPPHVEVVNGWVTCCVDSLRDKCKRDHPPCRYLHPPQHLKDQLLMIGRNLRNSNSYGGGSGFRGSNASSGAVDAYGEEFVGVNPYSMPAQQEFFGSPPGGRKGPWMESQEGSSRSNTFEVCREFLRGRCNRNLEDCRFAHPPAHLNIGSDNTVTVCMDFVRGFCSRETCRYFHPPPHLQNRMKSGGSLGSFGRKRPHPGGYRNGDDFGSTKRQATGDLYA